jgi:hypothetical protein
MTKVLTRLPRWPPDFDDDTWELVVDEPRMLAYAKAHPVAAVVRAVIDAPLFRLATALPFGPISWWMLRLSERVGPPGGVAVQIDYSPERRPRAGTDARPANRPVEDIDPVRVQGCWELDGPHLPHVWYCPGVGVADCPGRTS